MSPILGIMASQNYPRVTPSYESIATYTVASSGSINTVTFSSIPSTFKHLQIRAINSIASEGNMFLQFNGDAGASYYRHFLYGDGGSTGAGAISGTQSAGFTSTTAGQFGAQVIDVLDYTNTNKYKTSRTLTGFDNNGSGYMVLYSGLWLNTAAVTSLSIVTNSGHTFRQYSSFALYGIKG